ncbi:MAG: hypothetical protein ACRYE9_02245 [Janthinobacterium lividum]
MENRLKNNMNRKFFAFLVLLIITIGIYYNRNLVTKLLSDFSSKLSINGYLPWTNANLNNPEISTDGNDISSISIDSEALPGFIKPLTDGEQRARNTSDHPQYLVQNNVEKGSNDLKISDNYYSFMKSLNSLIANFFQDKSCTQQIEQLTIINFPIEIRAIFDDIAKYNSEYLSENIENYQIKFLGRLNFLNRFVKIKKTPARSNKSDLKLSVTSNIEEFLNYFCSREFQNQFIGQVEK